MLSVLRCECGFEVRAVDEAALIRDAQAHAEQTHHMSLLPEHILLAAFRAELEDTSWSGTTYKEEPE